MFLFPFSRCCCNNLLEIKKAVLEKPTNAQSSVLFKLNNNNRKEQGSDPPAPTRARAQAFLAEFLCPCPHGLGGLERTADTLAMKSCKGTARLPQHRFLPRKYQFKRSGNLSCLRLGSLSFEGFLLPMTRPHILAVNKPAGITVTIG